MSDRPTICWCVLCDEPIMRSDHAWREGREWGRQKYAHVSCIAKRDVGEIMDRVRAKPPSTDEGNPAGREGALSNELKHNLQASIAARKAARQTVNQTSPNCRAATLTSDARDER